MHIKWDYRVEERHICSHQMGDFPICNPPPPRVGPRTTVWCSAKEIVGTGRRSFTEEMLRYRVNPMKNGSCDNLPRNNFCYQWLRQNFVEGRVDAEAILKLIRRFCKGSGGGSLLMVTKWKFFNVSKYYKMIKFFIISTFCTLKIHFRKSLNLFRRCIF